MITITWATQVINVPLSYLTSLGGGIYEMDLNQFRLDLKALEASEEGIVFPDTHSHNTEVTVAGTTIARVVQIINGYTVTFEAGTYAVNLIGANSNVADVTNVNGVSIRAFNTAGLTSIATPIDIASAVWTESASSSTGGSMKEVLLLLYQLAGLDPTRPLVVEKTDSLPSARKVPADGSVIDQTIADTPTSTTVTRQ